MSCQRQGGKARICCCSSPGLAQLSIPAWELLGHPGEPGPPSTGRMDRSGSAGKACLHGASTEAQNFVLLGFFVIFFFKTWIPSCHSRFLKPAKQGWGLDSLLCWKAEILLLLILQNLYHWRTFLRCISLWVVFIRETSSHPLNHHSCGIKPKYFLPF